MNIARIMSKVVNRPLMLEPHAAEVIYSVLAKKAGIEPLVSDWHGVDRSANRIVGGEPVYRSLADAGPLYVKMGATAVVPVVGETANRGAYIGADSGVVTYEGIAAQVLAAARDTSVKQLLLDVESPGGEAVGAMEIASLVRRVNSEKPVFAFVNGMAASAGYALVSGAQRIFSVPSGIVGSIGVVLLHLDRSEQYAEAGIKPTMIHAGAHKVDANPFEPLSNAVKQDLQAEVMQFYDLFVSTVAAGRPGLSADEICGTEARTYIGQAAKDAGLIDDIATFEDVMSEMQRAVGRSTVSKGVTMTDTTGAPAATNAGASQEQINAAVAAANNRMTAVMSHADISGNAGRMAAASDLLAKTAMPAEDIVAFVSKTVPAASIPPIADRASDLTVDTRAPAKSAVKIDANAIYAKRAADRAQRGMSQ